MADFCRACSIENFGRDYKDYGTLDPCEPGYAYPVICEGCGFIRIDHLGNCVVCDLSPDKPGHNGKRLKPLEGGRHWEFYDFLYDPMGSDAIELGAPI